MSRAVVRVDPVWLLFQELGTWGRVTLLGRWGRGWILDSLGSEARRQAAVWMLVGAGQALCIWSWEGLGGRGHAPPTLQEPGGL